ncbi:hypothetical protein PENANT_c005G03903 [Penicillium antarcticum]|uniref:Bromo domain-containing protein n=1 Tax=Penicillium antarcticum TaxID=416450 RepID=A0A1V6QER3_9EURO|nr:uncharacterized protein N7508_007694 [Penicillium antarcticum]KAJ5297445.1 hypothetical protein N7508_007694 [Penicillium antarcticum]OQD87705.1 hypothetical protein PENANT_c005G03903 [Penicillium antarcticum]
MATPPPEAPPVPMEDKPQLPPSPTGLSAPDVAPASVQDAVVPKSDSAANTEAKSPALNGHGPAPSITNGTSTAASPPKSPAPAPADHASQEDKTPTAESATPAETQQTDSKDPVLSQDTAPAAPPAADVGTEKAASPTLQVPAAAPTTGATDGASDKMAVDTPQSVSTAVKTELPHHPTPDLTHPSHPAAPADQEMKDAPEPPMSPSKISRQRDADLSEEPAAKRTKVDGEDTGPLEFKASDFHTPTTTTKAPADSQSQGSTYTGQNGLTKMQHRFISKTLTNLKRLHDSRFYREPVDPIKLNIPQYHTIITQPMDLQTMDRKLKTSQYSSPQAVLEDFALMVQNTTIFNGPDHLVTQEGIKLKGTFEKLMANCPKPEDVEEKKPKKLTEKTSAARREPRTSLGSTKAASPQAQTFALGPEGLPVIRRDSSNPDGRPKRSIHPPKRDLPYSTKPKKKKFQWELRFCQEVMDELYKQKHYNWIMPFYYPVDPVALNIPTYHSVIKKPMDLSTVQSKLKTGQYENAKEFETDVRLIFKNCFRFNIPGDPTYVCGQRAEEIFNQKWAQKSDYLDAHEPQQEQNSDYSDEDSDEDAEESEEDDEKLTLLQKQIAEMSRQVEAITNKKKKTPPSSKKAGKAKSSKKDSRKSTSGKRDKKVKSAKPERTRPVTYAEKQLISQGISSLPDKKMQDALQLIQNNVPQLKGTNEAEIELDIDELPNNVLFLLLSFVKKNVPGLGDDLEEEYTPASSNVAQPKPKKNKPMSKFEQEAQINMLQNNLSRFQGGGGHSPEPMPSVEHNESSDDDSDSSEEESEEE